MRDNLVFSGIEEEPGEDLEEKIAVLLESIGVDLQYGNSGPVSFDRLHRFGTRNGGIPRPIVGKIHDYKDKVTILTMAPDLKDRNDKEKIKIFISDQFTDEVREKRTQAFAKFKANDRLPKENKVKMRLAHDKLFINGELDRPAVTRPSVIEVMTEDSDEVSKMDKIKVAVIDRIGEKGNTFTGVAVKAKSMQEVRLAMKKLLRMPDFSKAAHVMSAYRVRSGGIGKEGHYDDGEWGGGFNILKTIRNHDRSNVAVFVVRHHEQSDYKLGSRRFQLIQEAAGKALNKLAI